MGNHLTGMPKSRVVLKKKTKTGGVRRAAVEGSDLSSCYHKIPIARHPHVPCPGDVDEEADGYAGLSATSVLTLAVGVGQQLAVRLAPLQYAQRPSCDQAGHIAVLRDVRDVLALQCDAVSDAQTALMALERVLYDRLAEAEDALQEHGVGSIGFCHNCCPH